MDNIKQTYQQKRGEGSPMFFFKGLTGKQLKEVKDKSFAQFYFSETYKRYQKQY